MLDNDARCSIIILKGGFFLRIKKNAQNSLWSAYISSSKRSPHTPPPYIHTHNHLLLVPPIYAQCECVYTQTHTIKGGHLGVPLASAVVLCHLLSPFFSWKKSYCDHFCMKFGFQSCTRCKERTRLICYILLTLSSPAPSATRGHGSICHCISSQIPACHTITQGLFFSTSYSL